MAKSSAPSEADENRRSFLKQSAALVSGATISGCSTPPSGGDGGAHTDAANTDPVSRQPALRDEDRVLEALGGVVLPRNALGEEGVIRTVNAFREWLSGFESGAELDHPYLYTDEILYGPQNPAPVWEAQLEALELEANQRHGSSFRDLDADQQSTIVADQIPGEVEGALGYAGSSPHVALGLLSYFYATSEANDLGYRAAIETRTCRGLESAPQKPEAARS